MTVATHQHETSTRERILRLAIQVLDHGGEASIRVKQIADAAGVSVTSLYHFFGSREGLVEEALVARFNDGYRLGRDLVREAATTAQTTVEFATSLENVVRTALGPEFTPSRQRRINVAGAALSRPSLLSKINDAQREWLNDLTDGLALAQERGFISANVNVHTVATWHLITVNGVTAIEGDPTGADMEAWLDMYVDTMFRLVGLR